MGPDHTTAGRGFPLGPSDPAAILDAVAEALQRTQRPAVPTRQAAHEASELFRVVTHSSPLAIITADLEGRVLTWNPAAERMLGFTEAEALGRLLPHVPDPDLEGVLTLRQRVLAGEELVGHETKRAAKDGTLLDVSLNAAPVRAEDGRIAGVVAILADISERKRAEEALHRREQQFAALAENAPDIIARFDRDLRVVYVNPAVEAIGFLHDAMIGRTCREIGLDDAFCDTWEEALTRVFLAGAKRDLDFDLTVPAGPRSFAATIVPERAPDGSVESVLAVARDVTAHRSLEAQLLRSQKMEALGRLAGGIAHDFNNHLLVISGYARLLLDRLGGEEGADVEEIRAAADRAARLVRKLLAFSRRQAAQPVLVAVDDAIEEMERMLRPLIGDDVELVTALESGCRVEADPAQLEQVVMNLAVNARDAMPAGGTLTIETRCVALAMGAGRPVELEDGRYFALTVRDTGHGMDQTTRDRIFEPFFTTKTEGTGLGLATVYGIVRQSGGAVAVASAPGRGTSVTVYLPSVESAAPAPVAPAREERPARGSGTVVLVDDEEPARTVVRRFLEDDGYSVLDFARPREALDFVREHDGTVDLLVTDVVLPEMSGYELIERLRAVRPGLRALTISGYRDGYVEHAARLAQPVGFLQKPFGAAELARRVREALEAPAADSPPPAA